MKKSLVIFVFGFPSRIPGNFLDSFRELEANLSKTKIAHDQKIEFCFIRSFFLDDSICFSSQGDRNSGVTKGVNHFLNDKLIQKMILERLTELGGKKSTNIKFRASSGFIDFTGNTREEMPPKTI